MNQKNNDVIFYADSIVKKKIKLLSDLIFFFIKFMPIKRCNVPTLHLKQKIKINEK